MHYEFNLVGALGARSSLVAVLVAVHPRPPGSGAVRTMVLTCATAVCGPARMGPDQALNPRVRGSSPWRRTRSDLVLYPFWVPSWRPFRGHVSPTFPPQPRPIPPPP